MNACCILASSNFAANSLRSNCNVQSTCSGPAFCWKNSTLPLQQRVQIAGGLRAGLLLLAAEGAQVVGDFGRLGRRLLDLDQRAAPGMVRLHLAQHQRGVAQDAGQRVVEIQRHRPRQLQRAIQLLLVRQAGIRRRAASPPAPAGAALRQQLQHEVLLAVPGEGTNRREIGNRLAALALELERHRRGGGPLPLGQKLVGRAAVLRRPDRRQARRLAGQGRAKQAGSRRIGAADGARAVHQERRPARILQRKSYIGLHQQNVPTGSLPLRRRFSIRIFRHLDERRGQQLPAPRNSLTARNARLSATQTAASGAYSASNWRQAPQGIGPPGARATTATATKFLLPAVSALNSATRSAQQVSP